MLKFLVDIYVFMFELVIDVRGPSCWALDSILISRKLFTVGLTSTIVLPFFSSVASLIV